MTFAPDIEANLLATVELVNTAEDPDTLTTVEQLDAFYERHGYTGHRDRDAGELAQVRALRPVLRGLLTTGDPEQLAVLVNDLLDAHPTRVRLVTHGPLGRHLHVADDDSPWPSRICVEAAIAVSDVLIAGELSRFGVCADDGCDGIVLDLSRNRSRRFCSTACGNRHAAAEYRARQREQDQA
ncbi:MAG: CGNR zinc finger domain-containing protein [Propionibacteriales bacterium]|nr:CGNR zinc finger domain-containing protein [Propionibacteriales bacterium]